jgi:transcriptional regulator with XRE-family HTH domain
MDPINERIKELRTLLKMTQVNFSKKIYISQGSLGEIETGVRPVNDRIIQLISTEFNVNKNWLKTGKGGIFDIEKPDINLEHLIEIYKQLDKPLQDYLIQQSENLLRLHSENIIKKRK